jgi:transcriptional regulator with XRE-family HTH domain
MTAEPAAHATMQPTMQPPREEWWGPVDDLHPDSNTNTNTVAEGSEDDGVYTSRLYDLYANGADVSPPHGAGARSAPAKVRRAELATFLRSRRERLTPQDVGMPGGPRRRTPGLRREEVAQLAGVGVTWYTWLEQGRPINASTQVLDAIARTLRLDRDEHDHLYRLADVPSIAVPDERTVGLEPEVLEIIGDMTSLAAVLNERFDVLAWNRPYELVFPSLTTKRYRYRNTLWATFAMPGCCHPFVNRAEEMPYMVATLRAAYGRHVGEPCWEAFIKDLIEQSPEFARMWRDHEVRGHSTRTKIFRHPALGELRFKATSLGVLATPGVGIAVYRPADQQTKDGMAQLEAGVQSPIGTLPCGHSIAPVPV